MSDRPKGSGYFALSCGVLLLAAAAASRYIKIERLSPEDIVFGWTLFLAVILVGWGIRRVQTGAASWTVGQSTINFVVSLFGSIFALVALLKKS